MIVLPENTEIQTIDEDTISIIGCPVEISVGDIFGCMCDGIRLRGRRLRCGQTEMKLSYP